MSKKDKDKDLVLVEDNNEVVEFEEEKSLFEFIADKLTQNLDLNINITKSKKTGKIGLSFNANYDDK